MKHILLLSFICLLIFSCGKNQQKEVNTEAQSLDLVRNSFFSYLQNPEEVAAKLTPGLTGFDVSLLNDPNRFIDYTGNDVKAAANLGIYLADLNYCILNKQGAKTKEYFAAAHELSKVLLAEKTTLEFLMKRYENNIEQHDSVKLVMTELLKSSTLGLKGTDRERLAGIAMAAYQVENLHLALSALETFPEILNDEQIQTQNLLLQFVLNQRQKFELIYNFVRANSDPLDPDRNPNYPFYDNALRELIDVYQSVTENDPKVKELHERIDTIRNKMIRVE